MNNIKNMDLCCYLILEEGYDGIEEPTRGADNNSTRGADDNSRYLSDEAEDTDSGDEQLNTSFNEIVQRAKELGK